MTAVTKKTIARRMNKGLATGAFQSDAWQNRKAARARRVAKREATQKAFANDRRILKKSFGLPNLPST